MNLRPAPSWQRFIACVLGAGTVFVGFAGDVAFAQPAANMVPADAPLADSALPLDPRWVTGTLDNGLRYFVKSDGSREGQLVLRLSADAGSLREEKEHPGAAFLTAMLLHGAACDSPAGKAVLSLGEDLPAGTRATEPSIGQDAASFTVTLPIADDKAITLGLRHLFEIARGAGLDDVSILARRPMVRGVRAAMITRKDRLLAAVMPQIAPGTREAFHGAVPSDAAICNLENDSLREFHERYYDPPRLTIIAAGDAPAPSIIERIRREFGGLANQPNNVEELAEEECIDPAPQLRAAVAADPELPHAVAEIVVVLPGVPPVRTVSAWRAHLVDRLAASLLQRRLIGGMGKPSSPVRGGGVRIGPTPGGGFVAVASVHGDPRDWRELVAEVASRTAQACMEAPTLGELVETSGDVLRSISDEAAQAESRGPPGLVEAAWESVLRGDSIMSRNDKASLSKGLLQTVLPREVQAVLASRFRLSEAAFVLFMPDGAGTPPPIDVLAAALPALLPAQRDRPHEADPASATPPMAAEPAAGRMANLAVAARTGVTTATFENGVRFHHRRMSSAEPRVTISLTLAPPDADPANPPPPMESTSALWTTPAACSVSAERFQRLLGAAKVEVRSHVSPAQARIELSCPVTGARDAFRAIHLLVSEPRIEPAAFERWKWSMTQRVRARDVDPASAAFDALSSVSRTDATLVWRPTEADLGELNRETLQRWVEFVVAHGAIEAAIVGDIGRAEALELAATFLASLPARRVPDAGTVRALAFEEKQFVTSGPAKEAFVLVAVNGAAAAKDVESLDLAARILGMRLDQRGEPGLAPSKPIVVKHLARDAAHEAPLLIAVGTSSPALTASLAERMARAFASVSTEGPLESELLKARAQAIDDFDRQVSDSAWWSRTLSQSTAKGKDPDDILDARERLTALSRESIRDSLAAHDPAVCCGKPRLRITVTPAELGTPTQE